MQIQRAQRTLNTRIRRETSGHSIVKTLNIQKIEGLESWTRKITIHIKEKPITITADFSMEIIEKLVRSIWFTSVSSPGLTSLFMSNLQSLADGKFSGMNM